MVFFQPWETLEGILDGVDTMAAILSEYMVNEMQRNSIKHPELLSNFQFRSQRDEIGRSRRQEKLHFMKMVGISANALMNLQ